MAVFSDVEELKGRIVTSEPDQFFEECVLAEPTVQFGPERLDFVAGVLSREYNVDVSPDHLVVVGSSKIGFALHDKIRHGAIVAPAFRPYGADSDIDLSICGPKLFKLLWHELSEFACKQRNSHISTKIWETTSHMAGCAKTISRGKVMRDLFDAVIF